MFIKEVDVFVEFSLLSSNMLQVIQHAYFSDERMISADYNQMIYSGLLFQIEWLHLYRCISVKYIWLSNLTSVTGLFLVSVTRNVFKLHVAYCVHYTNWLAMYFFANLIAWFVCLFQKSINWLLSQNLSSSTSKANNLQM